MLALKGRQDKWRLLLPDDFIPEEINDKYSKILQQQHSFIYKPIDLLNESIQKIQVLGFNNGTWQQQQTTTSDLVNHGGRAANDFNYMSSEVTYRAPTNPITLLDKTLNIDFRHELGFLNYFLIFETFFYQYSRITENKSLPDVFPIEIFNAEGEVYSRIMLYDPIMDGLDMLDLDFSQPVAQSQTFRAIFKYSNIDFQFIEHDFITNEKIQNPVTKEDIPVNQNIII